MLILQDEMHGDGKAEQDLHQIVKAGSPIHLTAKK